MDGYQHSTTSGDEADCIRVFTIDSILETHKGSGESMCSVCKKLVKDVRQHERNLHGLLKRKRGEYSGARESCPSCLKEWSKSNASRYRCQCNVATIVSDRDSTSHTPDDGIDIPSHETNSPRRRGNEDQLSCLPHRGGLHGSNVAISPLLKVKKPQKTQSSIYLLCIGIPSVEDITNDDLLGLKVDLTDHEILNSSLGKTIKREDMLKLGETVGTAFVSDRNGEPVVHQAVMTTLLAGAVDNVHAEFQTWDWLRHQLKENKLDEYICAKRDWLQHQLMENKLEEHIGKKQPRVLLWVSNNNSIWPRMTMTTFYNHMQTMSALCGNLEVCLSQTEAEWEELKIGDIQAFDDIARHAEAEFSYRPTTCFGTGKCLLPSEKGETMVIKRSHSCGAAHVKYVSGSERTKLECVDTGETESGPLRVINSQKPIWFHQERIKSLETYGEFRVFFVRNKFIGAMRTKFEMKGNTKVIAAQPLSLEDFGWYSENPKEQKYIRSRLYAFAAFVRASLLERHDARERYRSLRVAVRIDIGVSELSRNGKFFVGEVARFAGAALFSQPMFPSPHTKMLELMAQAIVEEYGQ